MIFNTVYVELKNIRNYFFTTTVFDVPILVNVSYNNRVNKRYISITSQDSVYIYLKPTYITHGSRIHPTFTFTMSGVKNMFITLNDFTNSESDDYLNWGNNYRLAFVTTEEENVTLPSINTTHNPFEGDKDNGD